MTRHHRMWLGACLALLASPAIVAGAELKGVTVTDDNAITRIVAQLDKPVKYKVFTLKNPPRLVIDLLNTVNRTAALTVVSANVRNLRHAARFGRHYRLVLDLPALFSYQHRAVTIEPTTTVGYHVVVEMKVSHTARKAAVPSVAKTKPEDDLRDVVVVLDPGHGGKDTGAIGKTGSYEKNIVLQASRSLHRMLNDRFGITAYLTRQDDRYIPLRERIQIARRRSADVFVSIHADSAPKSSTVRGASVYMLSSAGASSEAARWLARQHNADSFVSGATIKGKDAVLGSILMDFSQTATMKHSKQLAVAVLDALEQKTALRTRNIESAGFAVLTSPDIPSILIELGYLSNVDDERQLNDVVYQKRLVAAVSAGIHSYLQQNAPPSSWFQQYTFKRYVVKSGDTLWSLARRNRVSVAMLKRVSGIKSDLIYPGQKLLFPVRTTPR